MAAGDSPAVVDLAFALAGEPLPADHADALGRAVGRVLPWIAEEPVAGIHPLRGAVTADGELLLARRTRLVLRLPEARVDDARRLVGTILDVGGRRLVPGPCRVHPLAPATTLYARLVVSEAADEAGFEADLAAGLDRLGVRCRYICGRRRRVATTERVLDGHSVVLHDIPRAQGPRLQAAGLGPARRLGCGILVPHRTIGGFD